VSHFSPHLTMSKAVVTLSVVCVLLCVSEATYPRSASSSKAKWSTYYVGGVRGNDSLCTRPESTVPCRSLEHVAKKVTYLRGSVKIVIQSPHLSLKEKVRFMKFNKIWMTGGHTTTTIECVPTEDRNSTHAGLVFNTIKQLTIEDITIYCCGALSKWYSSKFIRSAVHAIGIGTLVVTKTHVMDSNGTGILIISSKRGGNVVNILNSQFVRNKVPEKNISQHMGGGGIYVRMWKTNHNRLIFHECQFQNNRATTKIHFTYLSSFGIPIRGTGEGGG